MTHTRKAVSAAALLTAFALPSLQAQSGTPAAFVPMPNPDPRLAQIHAGMSHVKSPGNVAISPDGTLIAYTLRGPESAIHLSPYPANPSADKTISVPDATGCSYSDPVFSPDSQTVAFTSDCTADKKQDQIFLYSRSTGEVKQLTHVTGLFDSAAFSPDGKSIAFLFVENATRSAGALAAMKPWSGVIGEDGVEIQRVYSVSLSSGEGTWLTPANLHVYEFAWSPKSDEITFTGANPPGENNWWVAKLYTERAHEAEPKVVFNPNTTSTALHGLQIAVPRFSPDGKHIAFIGGLMSDQGSTGGDIWVVPASSGDPTDVTPNINGTPTWINWESDHTVGFVEDRSGHTLLNAVNINDRKITPGAPVDLGEVSIGGGPIKDAIGVASADDHKNPILAFVESGHAVAPELFAGPADHLQQITHLNDGLKPPTKTESLEWTNEGFHVQGWLTYPSDYDSSKKYPLLVMVHGGPSASAGARWGGSIWSDLGYFTFSPNPRGSFGEGEKFTEANRKDFGYGDLRDILAGMDAVESKVSIDKNREGITGWSYGGFMTMFAVTQTHRFKAAVAGAGLSDWLSYYGENSIDQWMVPFFGATVYDDPAVYAKSSAINFIKKVTTPTLVIVGDRDGECPAPQSFEFWHALRAEHVPTQLVVYPNEGHGFVDPAHIRDREAREVAWFAKYMPAQ
jgi:dipeptidyl aminopeptidase/acylaminoacyl peptidase